MGRRRQDALWPEGGQVQGVLPFLAMPDCSHSFERVSERLSSSNGMTASYSTGHLVFIHLNSMLTWLYYCSCTLPPSSATAILRTLSPGDPISPLSCKLQLHPHLL